jgi:histidinol-phosphatase
MVAEGIIDVGTEPEVALWDVAPLSLIVEEAGGAFTGLDGVRGPDRGSVVSTNGLLHPAVLAHLG